jgi:hypothetical protein
MNPRETPQPGSSPWGNTLSSSGPRRPPATDPTNPHRDETAGENVAAARANERRQAEPGLTEQDREERTFDH